MKELIKSTFITILTLLAYTSVAQQAGSYNAIYSGVPWFDDQGNIVSAHGACVIKDNDRYYLFGEIHADTSNAFTGFSCYSSTDLYNWHFERVVLPVQDTGSLGPNRVGERVKVMRCPQTGEYVMYMHTDNMRYSDQYISYATSPSVNGIYTFRGPLLWNNKPIRKWDMGTFQDTDGTGYLLIHGGDIYKLSYDYKSILEQTIKNAVPECESPAVFKKDSIYYWLASSRTSWERNDNFYATATSLKGPWTPQGHFAPVGTLTWNSQTTYVLPIAGGKSTTYMFMGDRWAYPHQNSAATYVWQPLSVSGTHLSISTYQEAWQIKTATGVYSQVAVKGKTIDATDKKAIQYNGEWVTDTLSLYSSDTKNASFSVPFNGKQIALYGLARPNGGYAHITLQNNKGDTILCTTIDMYCKYPVIEQRFISPMLAKGNYILRVVVMGERGNWADKRRSDYGSSGNTVSFNKVIVY